MVSEFGKKGYKNLHVDLAVYFLIEFGIIATIDQETALMPSMIQITPAVSVCTMCVVQVLEISCVCMYVNIYWHWVT